ncbi:hypothetical protein [Spiroplasma sp. AdecLV25b]|uniref:hypothetical protein n=1 Tax=Spiroplasma sp. AdecLV25b TaxID=3027162 RepID=UPI0027DF0FE3|nr:hypothetical protein [Spiroplasma sp. AdecLV25b]
MNFISWIGKLHRYSMNMSNKFKTLGNFFGGIIAVVTAVSYIKKTESFIMDSVHQISDSINEAEVYTAGACVALTIGGYTSGFTLGVIGYSLGTMNFTAPIMKKMFEIRRHNNS